MWSIDGLDLLGLRGAGGSADVYEAHEPALDRYVAVKIFRARSGSIDNASFTREAGVSGRLSGIRNVVPVYRSGVTVKQNPYLVMELMDGSMADHIQSGPLSISDAAHVGWLVADALAAAHAVGIVHGAIKPENILIDRYGEPALSDFGIPSLIESGVTSSVYALTPDHAAPEMFETASASVSADIYSLGSTLYALIVGHPPFVRQPGEGALSFMQRVSDMPIPSSEVLAAQPELGELLRLMLAKRPEDRPDLDAVGASLREIDRRTGTTSPPVPAIVLQGARTEVPNERPESPGPREPNGLHPRRVWSRRSVVTITGVVLAAVVVGLLVSRNRGPELREPHSNASGSTVSTSSATIASQPFVVDSRPTTAGEATAIKAAIGGVYPDLTDDLLTCVAEELLPKLSTESREFIARSPNILALPPSQRAVARNVISDCIPVKLATDIVATRNYFEGVSRACLSDQLSGRVRGAGQVLEEATANPPEFQISLANSVGACGGDEGMRLVTRSWLAFANPADADCMANALMPADAHDALEQLFLVDSPVTANARTPLIDAASATCDTTLERGVGVVPTNDDDSVSAVAFVARSGGT